MDTSVIRQPLPFEQDTICIRGMFLPDAGPSMAGCTHPAMVNVLAADGAVSSARTAAPAEDLRSRLTGCRRWRYPAKPQSSVNLHQPVIGMSRQHLSPQTRGFAKTNGYAISYVVIPAARALSFTAGGMRSATNTPRNLVSPYSARLCSPSM